VGSRFGRVFRTLVVVWLTVASVLLSSIAQAAPFAAIVTDARTGETLYARNADTRLHPASLTKMMTLYVAFEELEAGRITLDTVITVSKNAAAQPPSRLGLKPGQRIALRYLIRAAAIKSANDAASAIGDGISGNEASFAKRMNRTARALGMASTTFKNANGLTAPGHLSTARDMNTLGLRLFYDYPQYYHIFARRSADAGIATVRNTNSRFLDSYEGADGIKTGYTVAAGFNLTASAHRGKKHVIATVFGGTSTAQRNAKMAELMDIGFGKAPKTAPRTVPDAPDYDTTDALIAALEADPDLPEGGPGSAAKTVRVSGAVQASLRPKARPGASEPEVAPDVAVALAEGVAGAMAEATAPPPPEGTLDRQAVALVDPGALDPVAETSEDAPAAVAEIAAPPERPELPAATEVAVAGTEAPPPAPGTLEAQAVALAEPAQADAPAAEAAVAVAATIRPPARPAGLGPAVDVAEAPADAAVPDEDATSAAIALALAEAVGDETTDLPAETETASVAPPETPTETPDAALVGADAPLIVAEASPEDAPVVAPETAVAAAGEPEANGAETLLAGVEAVEAVSSGGAVSGDAARPARRAPIFEKVAVADVPDSAEEPEIVVAISTSGGGSWGVRVGSYTSEFEADKASFKIALAESATLADSLRRVVKAKDGYAVAFNGLSEDEAALACRRLSARAIPCDPIGP
jgi:D-alanyl-D-alanine carboxypeptidase